MQTLKQIAAAVTQQAQRIGAPAHTLPAFGTAGDDGCPFIEVDASHYHYVVDERGQEISRQSSSNLDDLMYWIFADVTHQMGFAHELKHRIDGQDFRRQGFAKQLELLGKIDPALAERRGREIEAILHNAPYDDGAG
jgi:hypothetical protein